MFEDPISALSHVVEKKEEDTVTVEAITLDEYCAKEHLEIIDILKIDAEMHEKNILLGAAQTLAKTKYLFLELTLRDHENYTFSEVLSLLHKERYSYQLIGFRNMAGLPEGEIPIVELLLQNKKFKAS